MLDMNNNGYIFILYNENLKYNEIKEKFIKPKNF